MRQITLILIASALAGSAFAQSPFARTTGASPLSSEQTERATALSNRLAALSPSVSASEAQRVAFLTYTTVRRLTREYQMVWPAGRQNYLIQIGQRKRGYCFHWTEDLMTPLSGLNLKTLELHWGEAFPGTLSENNCVVITARGQPFHEGILLDGWRYSGNLFWGPVKADLRQFEWHENKAQITRFLARSAPPPGRSARATR